MVINQDKLDTFVNLSCVCCLSSFSDSGQIINVSTGFVVLVCLQGHGGNYRMNNSFIVLYSQGAFVQILTVVLICANKNILSD